MGEEPPSALLCGKDAGKRLDGVLHPATCTPTLHWCPSLSSSIASTDPALPAGLGIAWFQPFVWMCPEFGLSPRSSCFHGNEAGAPILHQGQNNCGSGIPAGKHPVKARPPVVCHNMFEFDRWKGCQNLKTSSAARSRNLCYRIMIPVLILWLVLAPDMASAAQWGGPAQAPEGVWIGPGVSYQFLERTLNNGLGTVVRGGLVRINPDQTLLEIRPSLAMQQLVLRERLSEQARRHGSRVVAGINGDFFYNLAEAPGAPIGLLILDGELLSSPGGPAFGIHQDGSPVVGQPTWSATVTVLGPDGNPLASYRLCAVNKPRAENCLVLYTPAWGASTNTNVWGTEVTLLVDEPQALPLKPAADFTAQVRTVHPQAGNTSLQPGLLVLSGHGTAGDFLQKYLAPGTRVRISQQISAPWSEVQHAIGGGPILVQEGQAVPLVDDSFARRRTARTAVGVDAQGNLLWLVVDGGNSGWSGGITLPELQQMLLSAGARYAINLDGGGSSTLYIRPPGEFEGYIVNKPADGSERRIGNALLAISRVTAGEPRYMWVDPVAVKLLPQASTTVTLRAQDANYEPVRLTAGQIQWQSGSSIVQLNGTADGSVVITGLTVGETEVQASGPGIDAAVAVRVQVVGPEQIERVVVQPDPSSLTPGAQVRFQAVVYDKAGDQIAAGAGSFVWSGTGDFASITPDGEFTLASEHAYGTIDIALRITGNDGHEQLLPIHSQSVTIGDPIVYQDMLGHWAAAVVSSLSGRGVIKGYPDGTFGPERQVTRAEFGTMLIRAFEAVGKAAPGTTAADESVRPVLERFSDLDSIPKWSMGALAYATTNGLLGGYEDGSFRPNQPISRQEAAVILSRIPEVLVQGGDISVFSDAAEIGQWAQPGVAITLGAGLVQGYPDNTFKPAAAITRAEAAAMIHRLLGLLAAR